jgi:hypothetical protein
MMVATESQGVKGKPVIQEFHPLPEENDAGLRRPPEAVSQFSEILIKRQKSSIGRDAEGQDFLIGRSRIDFSDRKNV